MERFQSTHSLRSATPNLQPQLPYPLVSIHALLAECDITTPLYKTYQQCFNPRTPCGVRQLAKHFTAVVNQFQSTHSLRSATQNFISEWRWEWFQSTHSLRSATPYLFQLSSHHDVSIHALLAECDPTPKGLYSGAVSFNPRTPCGVRQEIKQ